jgi:hypothetical protein
MHILTVYVSNDIEEGSRGIYTMKWDLSAGVWPGDCFTAEMNSASLVPLYSKYTTVLKHHLNGLVYSHQKVNITTLKVFLNTKTKI